MSELLPITQVAYKAQQTAIRWSLLAAHVGLRSLTSREARPTADDARKLERRMRQLMDRDLWNVQNGIYPRDLLFQLPVQKYVSDLPRLASEIARMTRRARRGQVRELPDGLDLSRYPDYFRRNFHWQTDGYLSRRSAELYDLGVEFLFLGTADVMRRQILVPLARWESGFAKERQGQAGSKRILDLGCGTGRTLYQLSLARPQHKYYGLDLSPYYVERARELLAGRDVSLLIDNAEQVPLRDSSFDAIVSVFLFHELPLRARRNVLREMRRVLKPDGLLVIEDSAQLHDAPELEVFLRRFGREMNEPFFLDYLSESLEETMEAAGFSVESADPCFLSKVIAARPR